MSSRHSPFNPDWVSSPWDTVFDRTEELGISKVSLAKFLNMTERELDSFIARDLVLTDRIIDDLVDLVGGTVDFWIRRDSIYHERKEYLRRNDVY